MALKELKAAFEKGEIGKKWYIERMHDTHRHLFDYADFLKGTDIKGIEITDGSVVMTTRDGIRLVADPDDQRIIPIEILNFASYEKDVLEIVKALVEPGWTIFDIGSNIGWYSLNLAKSIPSLRIRAFEPLPKTFGYLQRNVELNGAANVDTNNFGFSNEEQVLTFYYYREGSGNASLANLSERDDVEMIKCRVRKLDDYLRESGESAPDFIKMDVEGAELFVVEGGIGAIAEHKPVIFAELLRKWAARFDYHPNRVIELLREKGYRCFTAGEGKLFEFSLMDEATLDTNFFFLHGEKHREKIASLCAG